jgi:hypothetical protein
MIYDKEDLEIKYWGGDFVPYNDGFVLPKNETKIKKNLSVFTLFLLFLILTPILIYGISKTDINQNKETKIASNNIFQNKKTVNQNTTDSLQNGDTKTIEIINNDSYWKIAKRACNDGKLYLSIATQNNNKALYQGDTVLVDCLTN